MRYWSFALVGIALASAVVAVVAWCTRALVERSLCVPGAEQLACTAEPRALGGAIAVCVVLAIPIASAIFTHRTRPAGTPLGALTLGLALCAAGGAGLYAGIRAETASDVETAGIIVGSVLLSVGPVFLIFGMIATGRRSPAPTAAARAAAATAATAAAAPGSSGAVFLDGGDARARAAAAAADARAGDIASQGFGQLAAMLEQVAEEARRAGERRRGAGGG